MNIIQAKALTNVFTGDVKAIDAIDFDVREGETFGFLGPNDAGKTTAIKMFNNLLSPTSGTATAAGIDVAKSPADVRKGIGNVS